MRHISVIIISEQNHRAHTQKTKHIKIEYELADVEEYTK